MNNLDSQIAELRAIYTGLDGLHRRSDGTTIVAGQLSFEASADGLASISDTFSINIYIPNAYPEVLPMVFETGGKIDASYQHKFRNKSLCLAVPVELSLVFHREPSLLGFVTNLVVPYLYGYCYSRKFGIHPFGERSHSGGTVEFFVEALQLSSDLNALVVLDYLRKYGFDAQKSCPCGSGRRVRHCHKETLRQLHDIYTWERLRLDFNDVASYCYRALETENLQTHKGSIKQIRKILYAHGYRPKIRRLSRMN